MAAQVHDFEGEDGIPLTLVPAWPAGASVDGDLTEWADTPSMEIEGNSDGGGRVWLAPSAAGFFFAGEIRDSEVQSTDRVEIALSFPAAELPPLGFASQWGTEEVPSAEWCYDSERTVGQDEEQERLSCKQWFADNSARRREIPGLFQARYAIGQDGAARHAGSSYGAVAMGAPQEGGPEARLVSVVRRFNGGYRFEALIPSAALPATAEAPLTTMRAVVEIVDADPGGNRVRSSAPASRVEKVETWTEAILKEPVHFGRDPALLERVLQKAWESFEEQRPFYYLPSNPQMVHFLINPVMGYQTMPGEPSPAIVDVDLDDQKPIGKLGDVTVVDLPLHPGFGFTPIRGLATFHAGELVDISDFNDYDVSKAVTRAPGLHVLRTYNGTMNPLGTGMCGACPRVDFEIIQVDTNGKLVGIPLEGAGGPEMDKIEVIAMNERTGFGVRGNYEDPSTNKKTGFEIVYRWDGKKGEYTRTDRSIPPL
jgi:hypothetical protein